MTPSSPAALNGQTPLHQVEIFQDLSPTEIHAMDAMMSTRKVAAGTVFYTPQQPTEVLFLLKQGRACLYHLSTEGKIFTTATLEAGAFFGEMTLLGQSLYGSYAEAVTPCLLCIMSRQDVKTMLLGDLRIANRVVEALGKRLVEAERRMAGIALKGVAGRVAVLLVQLAQSQLVREGRAGLPVVSSVEVQCTHEELARSVGANRETITKILNEWRLRKMVELHRGRIELLDLEELRRLGAD